MNSKVATTLLGLALAAAGCAHGSSEHRISWNCPHGSMPDDHQPTPNCLKNIQGAKSIEEYTKLQEEDAKRQQEMQANQAKELADAQARAQKAEEELSKVQSEAPKPSAEAEKAAPAVALEKRVGFDPAKANLDSGDKKTLDEVASALKDTPEGKVVIEGHTDSTGADKSNDELSSARADAVKDYLEQAGIPEDKLETKSFGASAPVASNESSDGRALNRSAVIKISAQD